MLRERHRQIGAQLARMPDALTCGKAPGLATGIDGEQGPRAEGMQAQARVAPRTRRLGLERLEQRDPAALVFGVPGSVDHEHTQRIRA